jgi:hypothetical protein
MCEAWVQTPAPKKEESAKSKTKKTKRQLIDHILSLI